MLVVHVVVFPYRNILPYFAAVVNIFFHYFESFVDRIIPYQYKHTHKYHTPIDELNVKYTTVPEITKDSNNGIHPGHSISTLSFENAANAQPIEASDKYITEAMNKVIFPVCA